MPQANSKVVQVVYEVPDWVAVVVMAGAICLALLLLWYFWPRRRD